LAFSLFGKKPAEKKPPPKKPGSQGGRPAAKTPSPAPPSEPPDDAPDLDFSNYAPEAPAAPSVPPPVDEPAPRAAPEPAPARVEEPAVPILDFGDLPSATPAREAPSAPAPAPAPAAASAMPVFDLPGAPAAPPASAKAAEPPKPPRKSKKDVDSIMCIEVEDGAAEMPPVIEEAAILFANGQADQAHSRLETALAGESLGAWQLQVWLMLFDVYQHLGQKARFEEKALEFVVKFERSPPVWTDAPKAEKSPVAARAGNPANVTLSGTHSAASANALEQLRKVADRQPKLRIDFAKLQGVDEEGCRLLHETLVALKKAKKQVYFSGEAQGLKLLRERAKPGDPSVQQTVWQLLLELYQQLGMQNEFEEAAVDFAVTYEVSPPSWEAPPPKTGPPPPESEPEADGAPADACYFEGEIAGSNDALFNQLAAYAETANPIVIDMSRTRRLDFVNAGRLLNVLEKLKPGDRSIVIRGVGEMVAALLSVMRITKIARVIPRK
jgi:anti-anti-sigma regulatory factor